MSDATNAGLIGLATVLVNVVVSAIVAAWALRRRTKDDAAVKNEAGALGELTRVRAEYLRRIERLEKRLDDKDAEIRLLNSDLSAARVTIAQQATRITDLEDDLAELHRERAS